MSVHQLPDGRWICKWTQGGKQRKEYFGRGKEAEERAKTRNTELGIGVAKNALATPTLHDLAVVYLERKRVAWSDSNYTQVVYKIDRLLARLGRLQAHQLNHAAIDAYVEARRSGGVKFNTINGELTYLHAILNAAVERGLIIANPAAKYKRPKNDDDRIRPPSAAEFDAILSHAAHHLQRVMLICRYTGIRPGPVEAFSLRWEDCDLFAGLLMVKSAGKGGARVRNVPLSAKLVPLLREWSAADAAARMPWMIHFRGKPVVRVERAWDMALLRAGVTRRLRLYDLRHMAASNMLAAGASVGTVAKILGNSPVMVLKHYEHVIDPQVINAISTL